jgi:DNA-binding NarL/FixJ family response regulator
MIRVFIADDHTIVRKGLRHIVEETGDITIVAEACSGNETLKKARDTACDVLVLDITMPDMNGIDVLRQIRNEGSRIPVLVLSMHPETHYAVRLLRAGASGYLTKDRAPEELVEAIRCVAQGKRYITSAMVESLVMGLKENSEKPGHLNLSDREFQVLVMIGSGITVKEIADKLHLSIKTVSTYRTRILEKMSMKTNAQLTHYVVENKLTG